MQRIMPNEQQMHYYPTAPGQIPMMSRMMTEQQMYLMQQWPGMITPDVCGVPSYMPTPQYMQCQDQHHYDRRTLGEFFAQPYGQPISERPYITGNTRVCNVIVWLSFRFTQGSRLSM